ncbi:hypothetical protein N9W12_07355 [Luminiphilus sp.]|nr:hypothetical protein [Luminiphilus sp.]
MGQQAWRFEADNKAIDLVPADSAPRVATPIVLVSRSLCFEVEKHIPVDSWAEARRIAQNIPVAAPFEGLRKVKLVQNESGGHQALVTIIDHAKINKLVDFKPIGVIPQSWFLHSISGGVAAQIEFADEALAFSPSGAIGLTAVVNSKTQSRDFWWGVGSDPAATGVIQQSDTLKRLPSALLSLGLMQWLEVFRGNELGQFFKVESVDWLTLLKTAGVYAAIYLMTVSLLLVGAGMWVRDEVTAESNEFLEALAIKSELNRLVAEDKRWQSLVGEQYPVWSVSTVLDDIWGEGVAIRSISYDAGAVEVYLFAEDATEILATVIDSPYSQGAGFGAPVQNDSRTNLDRFSIRWEVRDAALDEQELAP